MGERGWHIRKTMAGWIVFHGAKARSPAYSSHHIAAQAQKRLEREARTKLRPCLTCGTTFASEGPHNRMCGKCRHRDNAAEPVSIGTQSGLA